MWHKHKQLAVLGNTPRRAAEFGNATPKKETNTALFHVNSKTILRQKSAAHISSNSLTGKGQIEGFLTARANIMKQEDLTTSGHKIGQILLRTVNKEARGHSSQIRLGLNQLQSMANSCLSQASASSQHANSSHAEEILSFSNSIIKRPSFEVKTKIEPTDSNCIYVESPIVRDKPATFDSVISFAGSTHEKLDNLAFERTATPSQFHKSQNCSKINVSPQVSCFLKSDSMLFNGEGYRGERKGLLRHGKGTYIFEDGARYDGNWYLHQMSGYGKLYFPSGKLAYEGEWSHDCLHGKGRLVKEMIQNFSKVEFTNLSSIDNNWIEYQGDFVYDKRSGFGRLFFADGSWYEGSFEENLPSGKGIFTNQTKRVKGVWYFGFLQRIEDQYSYNY